MFKTKILPLLFLLSCINAFPQTNFNLEAYKLFLQNHQNMSTGDLLQMHPAGSFYSDLNLSYDDALFFSRIDSIYNLTQYEKDLISSNGFMVSERLSRHTFGEPLLEIYNSDLPVYISSDAVLHSLHQSYDRILKDVELGKLINSVQSILNGMHQQMQVLALRYGSVPPMIPRLKDADVYLTVARKLLNINALPFYPDNSTAVNYYLSKINTHTLGFDSVFSANCRMVDWSQFIPRGHYVDEIHPELASYFKCMMWLGRIELYLLAPSNVTEQCAPDYYDVQRQTILSILIKELYELGNVNSVFTETEDVLKFFVGESDNVTIPDLFYMQQAVPFTYADELLDSLKLITFQDTLKKQSFAYQKILSQVLISDPFSPDSIIPASAFLLFGQRFVIDSYVMGSVVYDRIPGGICRLYPSTLDPLFALGNDAAGQLLVNELDLFHYASNLAALRYLINSYESDFWESSIYNSWLYGIKALNPPYDRGNLPQYMKTAAFWQKQMSTQLNSWTELRHDNLLYAKQSYTGGTICTFPYTYVEPFPAMYGALHTLGVNARNKFQQMNFADPGLKAKIISYFTNLQNITDTLETICEKELNGIQFTEGELDFLHRVIYSWNSGSGEPPYAGWYPRLLYDDPSGLDALLKQDYIVADVHTVPTDCGGNFIGSVVHVGTGPVNLGVFITEVPGNMKVAFIGPVGSYYDYRTLNFQRLTDQDWKNTYLYQSLRPDWVNIYLADSSGNYRGPGGSLITGNEEPVTVPEDYQFVKNYPNPFNPSTTITFNIPLGMAFRDDEVAVFNIQGELIKVLYHGSLPQGNYMVKWDGTNSENAEVSSGVYICRVKLGSDFKSLKLSLIK